MKKKIVLIAAIFATMLSVVSCGPKDCKAEGCSKDVYEEGYCELHYMEKAFEEGMEDLGDLFE